MSVKAHKNVLFLQESKAKLKENSLDSKVASHLRLAVLLQLEESVVCKWMVGGAVMLSSHS